MITRNKFKNFKIAICQIVAHVGMGKKFNKIISKGLAFEQRGSYKYAL